MKRFILSYEPGGWLAQFEVDLEKAKPACQASLDFFGDPVTREDDSAEETVRAFLKLWGPSLIQVSMDHGRVSGDPESMIKAMTDWEGIFPLDGSQGVTLVYCDAWDFGNYDFEVSIGQEVAK